MIENWNEWRIKIYVDVIKADILIYIAGLNYCQSYLFFYLDLQIEMVENQNE